MAKFGKAFDVDLFWWQQALVTFGTSAVPKTCDNWVWLQGTELGPTAGFSLCFWYPFLSHSQLGACTDHSACAGSSPCASGDFVWPALRRCALAVRANPAYFLGILFGLEAKDMSANHFVLNITYVELYKYLDMSFERGCRIEAFRHFGSDFRRVSRAGMAGWGRYAELIELDS